MAWLRWWRNYANDVAPPSRGIVFATNVEWETWIYVSYCNPSEKSAKGNQYWRKSWRNKPTWKRCKNRIFIRVVGWHKCIKQLEAFVKKNDALWATLNAVKTSRLIFITYGAFLPTHSSSSADVRGRDHGVLFKNALRNLWEIRTYATAVAYGPPIAQNWSLDIKHLHSAYVVHAASFRDGNKLSAFIGEYF